MIGFGSFDKEGLNEMLTYHISQSKMRKRVVATPNDEASLSFSFWQFLNDVSVYLFKKARDLAVRNMCETKEEEIGLVQGLLYNTLMRKNLNPRSYSERFRMPSKLFLRWYALYDLC